MIPALALSYLAAMVVAILWVGMIDRAESVRLRNGAQPLPSAAQVRKWRKSRLRLATGNRRRM